MSKTFWWKITLGVFLHIRDIQQLLGVISICFAKLYIFTCNVNSQNQRMGTLKQNN